MAAVYKWRVRCLTDSKFEYVWSETEPTGCPVDGAHTINASMTAAVEVQGVDGPRQANGAPIVHLDAPEEQDGKPNIVPVPFTQGLYMFISARGDNLVGGVVKRGEGTKLHLTWAANDPTETKELVVTFHETVEMHDGHVDFPAADWGFADEWNVHIRISATPVTPNGSGTGNCDLVAAQALPYWDSGTSYVVGDMCNHGSINWYCIADHTNQQPPNAAYWINTANIIVPAAGDGDYDVDLSTAIAVPYSESGYWDYDIWADTFTPSPNPGLADWMLFDFAMDDIYLVKNLMCSSQLGYWELDAYKIEPLYPRWQFVMSVKRDDSASRGAAEIGGHYTCFRVATT